VSTRAVPDLYFLNPVGAGFINTNLARVGPALTEIRDHKSA